MRNTSLNCTHAACQPLSSPASQAQVWLLPRLHDVRVAEVAVVDNLPLDMLGDRAGPSGYELDGHLRAAGLNTRVCRVQCSSSAPGCTCLPVFKSRASCKDTPVVRWSWCASSPALCSLAPGQTRKRLRSDPAAFCSAGGRSAGSRGPQEPSMASKASPQPCLRVSLRCTPAPCSDTRSCCVSGREGAVMRVSLS